MKKLIYLVFYFLFVITTTRVILQLYNYNMQVINPAYTGAEADLLFSFLTAHSGNLDDSPKNNGIFFFIKEKTM